MLTEAINLIMIVRLLPVLRRLFGRKAWFISGGADQVRSVGRGLEIFPGS